MIMDLAECEEHNIPSSSIFFLFWGISSLYWKVRTWTNVLKMENKFLMKFSSLDTGGRNIHLSTNAACERIWELGRALQVIFLQYSHLNHEKEISDLW